ncbi:unnamed protein product [Brassica rapa]|uniref:Aldehyde dehydrogenase domain-containing protein n=3 Tax=Brassica TaxID=3705 RepID=A0A3P6BAE0_BRACM|nr:unnamed protein product [Brassica napus]CAG7904628.1 unnamed protein product [Brassica rapa]VDD02123.1 unnamed protein product [Brassica rapa]
MKAAAELGKLVSMELGGKIPLIVFDDVDFDKGECHNKLLRDMVLSAFTFSRHVLDPV